MYIDHWRLICLVKIKTIPYKIHLHKVSGGLLSCCQAEHGNSIVIVCNPVCGYVTPH
jgi:hypothetical protein